MDKVANGNMKLKLFYELQEVLGDQSGVTGARLRSTETGATEDLPVTGVFIAIGHKPNTGIFEGQVDMENGYIVTRSGLNGLATMTPVPGVFAAGDVQRSEEHTSDLHSLMGKWYAVFCCKHKNS